MGDQEKNFAELAKEKFNALQKEEDELKAKLAQIQKEKNLLPPDTVEFIITQDDSIGVRDKFNIVKWNGIFGLILVLVILSLFLNIGTSFWVAMGIPISLMGAIIFLPVFDR